MKRRGPGNVHAAGVLAAALLVTLGAPVAASAHVDGSPAGGLASGLLHPVSDGDHVLAMIAVGVWGAQLGAPAVWMLPVAFPMVMAFGGMLGLAGVRLPGVEIGIALSAVALGAAVLAELRPPLWLAAAMVGLFAVFHGHAHGAELPAGGNALFFSMGFVMATGGLHAAGIVMGLAHRWPAGKVALRCAGAFITLGGLYFLSQAR